MTITLYGRHGCMAALKNPKRQIEKVWVSDDQLAFEIRHFWKNPIELIDKKIFKTLLPHDAIHQGIAIKTYSLPLQSLDYLETLDTPNQRILILDQLTDPHNIGAILRSAAAFDFHGVVMMSRHMPGETAVMVKAASGAFERVTRISVTNISQGIQDLKKLGFWCYGLGEQGQTYLHQANLKGKIALILGSEGSGMRQLVQKNCDEVFRLFTNPHFSTLNVSNAAAIAMSSIYHQHENGVTQE